MTSTTDRRTLNAAQRIALADHIRAEYATSKLDDTKFAEATKAKLGFEVGASQIRHLRHALNIASTKEIRRNEAQDRAKQEADRQQQLDLRLHNIESSLQALSSQIAGANSCARNANERADKALDQAFEMGIEQGRFRERLNALEAQPIAGSVELTAGPDQRQPELSLLPISGAAA